MHSFRTTCPHQLNFCQNIQAIMIHKGIKNAGKLTRMMYPDLLLKNAIWDTRRRGVARRISGDIQTSVADMVLFASVLKVPVAHLVFMRHENFVQKYIKNEEEDIERTKLWEKFVIQQTSDAD